MNETTLNHKHSTPRSLLISLRVGALCLMVEAILHSNTGHRILLRMFKIMEINGVPMAVPYARNKIMCAVQIQFPRYFSMLHVTARRPHDKQFSESVQCYVDLIIKQFKFYIFI